MRIFKPIGQKNFFYYVSSVGIGLAVIFFVLSLLLPVFLSSNYYQKSLDRLRQKSGAIKKEFSSLIDEIQRKREIVSSLPFPQKKENIFSFFNQLQLDSKKEGAGYYDSQENLLLWKGNVIDLKPIFLQSDPARTLKDQKASLLIHDKASVYLVAFQNVGKNETVVLYRLLAFIPRLKSPYSGEYHFVKPKLLKNCDINYWDFQEDVSGFEKIFSKHKDEYIGQPKLQNEIQTLFFPLRDESHHIVATVTLSSPSLALTLASLRENFQLVIYSLIILSLAFFIAALMKAALSGVKNHLFLAVIVVASLIGVRILFFSLSSLDICQSLKIFSPSTAGFLSPFNLTKSPADIFLTALSLFVVMGFIAFYSRSFLKKGVEKPAPYLSFILHVIFLSMVLALLFGLQEMMFRLVLNTNVHLLRFSLDISFFLLHLSLLLFFFLFFLISLAALRLGARYSSQPLIPFAVFSIEFGLYVLLFRGQIPVLLFIFQGILIFAVVGLSHFPQMLKKKEILFSIFILATLFLYTTLHCASSSRNRMLFENSLQNIIKSQGKWGIYFLQESLPEIEKKKTSLYSFFRNQKPRDLAHVLWEKTRLAKFNWYSSLEILDQDGLLLSRFSLNVPELYRIPTELPISRDWSIIHQTLSYMGKEKDFLIGCKDWYDGDDHLGKTLLYLSVDYDMLPFLYSANPYFELLRAASLPSLNQLDLGFAIFDLGGKLLFNPDKLSSGIPSPLLQKIRSARSSVWSFFIDRNTRFQGLFFTHNSRIYALLLPGKGFLNFSVEFLKVFFFDFGVSLLIFLLYILLFDRKRLKKPLWSFSSRVYVSFLAIALIPLLLFALLTRNFFSRIYTQQFTEKAEVHADFAKQVLEDFIFLQQEEQMSLALPPDNVVLWISSTISSDVSLYQDGRLISSSRREFFDYGLLPELIDGEIFYKIQYENNPFYTQTQKIGDYSFHTLTVPYPLKDSLLLISLPFPLEQQEIAQATAGLIEFLFFISAFLIIIAILFARGIGGMIVNPIKKLLDGTKEVSLGNLEISIPRRHEDEMKTLFDGFNAMVRNLKKHRQEIADMSKKVAWAEMAHKVAHEIKNPLTPIQLSAEHILKVYEDQKEDFQKTLKESVSYIIKEVENLRKIAMDFLVISKEATLKRESLDLKILFQETVEPYKKILQERITFKEVYKGENFCFSGDGAKIKIALRNILTNAIEAIQDRGEISITVSESPSGLTGEIQDTGAGIPKNILGQVLTPYFSTKDVGTGLGLPIAKKILEDHGGSISITSTENKGTIVTIQLPGEK